MDEFVEIGVQWVKSDEAWMTIFEPTGTESWSLNPLAVNPVSEETKLTTLDIAFTTELKTTKVAFELTTVPAEFFTETEYVPAKVGSTPRMVNVLTVPTNITGTLRTDALLLVSFFPSRYHVTVKEVELTAVAVITAVPPFWTDTPKGWTAIDGGPPS